MGVPSLKESMEEAGLQEVDTYTDFHHSTVAQYMSNRPIMELCMTSEKHPGTRVSKRWWDQECLELEDIWTSARAAELEDINTA